MFSSLKFWIDLKLAFVIIICKEKNSNPTGERSHCRDPSLYLCSLHGRLKKKEYEEICNNEFFLILYTLENEFQHLPLNSEFVYIRTLIIFFLEPLFWVECFKKEKKIIIFFLDKFFFNRSYYKPAFLFVRRFSKWKKKNEFRLINKY